MTAQVLRILAVLAFMGAASAAQQSPSQSAAQTLDDVNVAGPPERDRQSGPATRLKNPNQARVLLQEALRVELSLFQEQTQVVFRRKSTARRLPASGTRNFGVTLQLELLPDRIVALKKPWISSVQYFLDAGVGEADGMPAHIPFGPDAALVNLEYLGLRDSGREMSISLWTAIHPQTRQCERTITVGEFWPEGISPYILLGNSLRKCRQVVEDRNGDLLFAGNIPARLEQELLELYDPIASRLSNRLGSEPGNLFVALWEDSPDADYRLEPGWGRNNLLLFKGAGWEQGLDAVQRDTLREAFMREQIQRRIRESDWPGPFTQSAVRYLLLLTSSTEEHETSYRLGQALPGWMSRCATRLGARAGTRTGDPDVSSVECGLLLQFVYDAVARAESSGKQTIYDTWRRLLDESYARKQSGVKPAEFLASSDSARRIAQGLVEGDMEWSQFAAALDKVGVKLEVATGAASPEHEVVSLENFLD